MRTFCKQTVETQIRRHVQCPMKRTVDISGLSICMLCDVGCFVVCVILFQFTFSKIFRNTIKVSNSLDSDQAGRFVIPGLGPNCLQKATLGDKKLMHIQFT